jgi:hypothetical protein
MLCLFLTGLVEVARLHELVLQRGPLLLGGFQALG